MLQCPHVVLSILQKFFGDDSVLFADVLLIHQGCGGSVHTLMPKLIPKIGGYMLHGRG